MERKSFADVLKEAKIDIRREYDRLYELFYETEISEDCTIKGQCELDFDYIPFCGTCISLEDFNDTYGFHFEKNPRDFDLNYLINFCEYSYNLVVHLKPSIFSAILGPSHIDKYLSQVQKVINLIGYTEAEKDNGLTIFVPADQVTISVAEIIDKSVSYRVIEYNHHSMAGDLKGKRAILQQLANSLEPKRSRLKQINAGLEDKVFYLFNTVNIRHNNAEPGTKKYHQFVADMDEKTLEEWYDDTYQLCLLAFLEMDNLERKERVSKLKVDVG